MKKVRVLLSFVKLTVAEKIAYFKNVISKMTGNTAFPEPDVSLASATELVTDLENANSNSLSGSHAAIAQRNHAEAEADKAFRKLAMYVERIADGDMALILSSGFQLSKQPEPAQRPQFLVEAGEKSGEVALTRKAQPKAQSYVWQYCIGSLPANGNGAWTFAGASTRGKFTIDNLESGSKCWFRVAAVTTEGMSPWTDPIMKVIP